ncbi:MAG: IclR family transcriptional regulator [Pseudomonadota bacterium]
MSSDNEKPAPRVDSTLSKGLLILELLVAARGSRGVSDLSRELGLTKSNTYRLLQTLCTLGYVRHLPDKTYRATLKTWQVGRTVVDNMNLREVAAPLLRYLSEETGETIYLAVREALQVVYIDKIDSQKPIRSWNPIGGVAPLHCVGTGKAMLAADYGNLRDLVSGNLERFTDLSITTMNGLDEDVRATIDRGYAIDHGEFRERIKSIGSAIILPDGSVAGALGVSVPDVNLNEGDEDSIGAKVLHAARSVTEKLARL